MSSVGGPYSGLPLGEPIHVFFWGALFMSSVGGPHSCFLLGELIQPLRHWPPVLFGDDRTAVSL